MIGALDNLRGISFAAVLFKLFLAMSFGGFIGIERERKRRPAGFRTYILVCIGAALTVILSEYEYIMLNSVWQSKMQLMDLKIDVSRYGAQVINGIGFLGAGTILVTGRQEVKGLTTAAGLWASGCLGLVIGAGFYEAAVVGFVVIGLSHIVLPKIEEFLTDSVSNMNIYIEVKTIEDVRSLIIYLKTKNISVYQVDLEKGRKKRGQNPNAVLMLGLNRGMNHSLILSELSELQYVETIEEI